MIDLLILALVVMVLLENNPNRKRAAGQLFGRARQQLRGLWS